MRTRIKVCGITRPQDAELAVRLGADAIGMVFHAESPRFIEASQARLIRSVVPAFVDLVGVFVNASANDIGSLHNAVGFDLVQLHGDESSDFAQELGLPYIKALSDERSMELNVGNLGYADARGFLLDSRTEHAYGGTGKPFDEAVWPTASGAPLVLAGGLAPGRIANVIARLQPHAVDLNSGVERSPGIKDGEKLTTSFEEIRAADLSREHGSNTEAGKSRVFNKPS